MSISRHIGGWDAQWLFMFRYHSGTLSGNLYCTAAEPHTVMQRQIASKIKAIRNALLRLQIENSSHGGSMSQTLAVAKPHHDARQAKRGPQNPNEKTPRQPNRKSTPSPFIWWTRSTW